MQSIDHNDFKTAIDLDLATQKISGKILLDRFCVIDEESRRSPAYIDPNFSGFYYHLGKKIKPESMIEIGFDLGLLSGSFLTSCKSVKRFLGFREKSKHFASLRLGKQNIKRSMKGERDFYIGSLYDLDLQALVGTKFDLVIITDESNYDKHLEYFDFIWSILNDFGIIVVEYLTRNSPSKQAFLAFCKSKNRESLIFKTRYGTGLVQK